MLEARVWTDGTHLLIHTKSHKIAQMCTKRTKTHKMKKMNKYLSKMAEKSTKNKQRRILNRIFLHFLCTQKAQNEKKNSFFILPVLTKSTQSQLRSGLDHGQAQMNSAQLS